MFVASLLEPHVSNMSEEFCNLGELTSVVRIFWCHPTDYADLKHRYRRPQITEPEWQSPHEMCHQFIKISSLFSPPTHNASVNDIRAQGELLSRLACQGSQLTAGLWCPLCSISVWLWDSRLKQTLIIPLVKHADKFFFISNSSVLVYFGSWKASFWGALQLSNWYGLCLSTLLQGEIGEKGQKVNAMHFHELLFL